MRKENVHPIQKAAHVHGSQASLASALKVSRGALNQWMKPDREVPIIHCATIERLCAGKVTRKDLRPNDWQEIWPELAANAQSPHSLQSPHESNSTPTD